MAESSISVAVRVRPFSGKEKAQLAPTDTYQPFLGDGGLSGGSPSKSSGGNSTVNGNGTGPGLRTKYLRNIVQAVDDKVLIFDAPENNPLYKNVHSGSGIQNTFAHGMRKPRDIRYAFDRVFDGSCGQEMVFENTTKPLLDGILNGFNASVFAYGATGCGKTHTISGTPEDPGVIFLTMRELYQRIEESREDSDVQIRLSYLEIYNEQIRDLLSPNPTPPGQGLMLREDASNRISVVGITEHVPESPERVLDMIQEGNRRRTMSPTEANAVSSRSHAVLQINVTQRPRTADTVMETTSASLNIIDLAGSERAAATRNNGARMKEGANINKSLLALGNCINALCQSGGQKGRHIPYRNSKLTRLLKFSLGGNCKTVMIVCVSPSSAHYDETYNTLKYANQAKNIRTKVSRNMLNVDRHVAQYVQAIHELKEEVAQLKAKLADRAAVESTGEKRRRMEMVEEVEEVKKKMRTSTDSVKATISQKAVHEALIMAANVRVVPLRQRLQQLEEGNSSAIDIQSADIESEKQVLRKMISRQEAILADRTMQSDIQALANSFQLHRGALLVASNNVKFDEQAVTSIRIVGESMLTELEAHKDQILADTMSKQLGAGMGILADFAAVGARCTVALKETANELEKLNDPNAQLIEQLRATSQVNDEIFTRHIGIHTAAAAQSPTALRRSTVLRRTRSSIAGHTSGPITANIAGPAARLIAQKRASMVPPSSAASAIALSGNNSGASLSNKTTRRPSVRRVSAVGVRRTSQPSGRRVSQNVSEVAKLSASVSAATPPISAAQQPKKAFRWADEVENGAINDNKDESDISRHSRGPSGNIRTSLSAITNGSSQTVPSVALNAPGLTSIRRDMIKDANETSPNKDMTSSSTEWEDMSKDAFEVAPVRKPLVSSRLANESVASKMITTNAKKREGMFERNFLRKKTDGNVEESANVVEHSSSSDAMDTDESTDDLLKVIGKIDRNGDEIAASVTSSTPLNHSVRSSPYQRRRSSTSSTSTPTSGIGPIRTKTSRSSVTHEA